MNLDLQNKRALVCQGTQDFGRAVAGQLAIMGADVILLASEERLLQQVIEELFNDGKQKHSCLCADLNNPEEVRLKVKKDIAANGTIQILINHTVGLKSESINQVQADEFRTTFESQLIVNHLLALACLEGMKASSYGRIVNIISAAGKEPIKESGVSKTIKAAIAGWSQTLANEVARYRITVNNVLTGAINTARFTQFIEESAQKSGRSFHEIAREIMKEIPAGRFGETEEVANAVAFLTTPAAGYITGINLAVDGGRTGCR
ncbi:MAG: SDR family oxidoreductase [Bacteroidia bacterium]|nr:SDR family oxidoreductase [Bacteroidia bacterium]MCZ2277950.1 SDR family oxidoreductase [Bacteroidia bacterium]